MVVLSSWGKPPKKPDRFLVPTLPKSYGLDSKALRYGIDAAASEPEKILPKSYGLDSKALRDGIDAAASEPEKILPNLKVWTPRFQSLTVWTPRRYEMALTPQRRNPKKYFQI